MTARYFFHVSDGGGTLRDEDGTILSEPDAAMLRAATIAADLTRDAEYSRGFLVCAVDQDGTEVARCQTLPQLKETPGQWPRLSTAHEWRSFRHVGRKKNERQALTARQREVLTWIAQGKSAREVGEILKIKKRTVDEHAQAATEKLGALNRTQAVAIAVRDRLVEI